MLVSNFKSVSFWGVNFDSKADSIALTKLGNVVPFTSRNYGSVCRLTKCCFNEKKREEDEMEVVCFTMNNRVFKFNIYIN